MKFFFIHLLTVVGTLTSAIDCRKTGKFKYGSSPANRLDEYDDWDFVDTDSPRSVLVDYQNYEAEHHRLRHHRHNGLLLLHPDIPWPVKKEAIVEGDIILGGLMMVHERKDNVTCGPVMPQGGIQALEAMLYTLDRLNRDRKRLLPNITLGAHILDDCDKDTYGLEMAVDFIKG